METAIYDGVEYICTTPVTITTTDTENIPDVYSFPRLENGRFVPIPAWDF